MGKKHKETNGLKKSLSLGKLLIIVLISAILAVSFKISRMTYSTAEKDFLYLSDILKKQTSGIDSKAERLRRMTDWLHVNVKHGKYPPGFKSKGVANIIRGGKGNCGFQACNIACFAELLGLKEHRIIHNRKEWGAPGLHTFAEVNVDGRWIIYDPDNWQYILNNRGQLVGTADIVRDTSIIVKKDAARWIYSSIKNKGYKISKSWQDTPLPYGKKAYKKYEKYGKKYFYVKKVVMGSRGLFFVAFILIFCSYILLFLKKNEILG